MKTENHNKTDIVLRGDTRRNFVLSVINGSFFQFARGLLDPSLVLTTWFVGRLTSSNVLLALVTPLGQACWFLPQLFFSARIQRMEFKKPLYAIGAAVRIVAWLSLAAVVWLVDDPAALLISFFILYAVANLAAGPGGLVFFDIIAKTIPARRRGTLWAARMFIGGVLALGANWIVNVVLGHPALPPPHDVALLIALFGIVLIPSFTFFLFVREPPGVATERRVGLMEQLQRVGALLRENPVYRRYNITRLLLGLTGVALPFYSVYAKNVLGAEASMAGIYAAASTSSRLLSNLLWGRISDRQGNQLVLRLLTGGRSLTLLLALSLVGLRSVLPTEGAWLPYLALPLFMLDGAMFPAGILAGSNFLMELVSEKERPICLGLTNTLTGIVTLLSVLGGLLVDLLGYAGLFGTALGLCLGAYAAAVGLPEPRQSQRVSE